MELAWKVLAQAEETGRYVLRCAVEPTSQGLKRADVKDLSIKAENMAIVMYHMPDLDKATAPLDEPATPTGEHVSVAGGPAGATTGRACGGVASEQPIGFNNSVSSPPISTQEQQSPVRLTQPSRRDADDEHHRRAETHTPTTAPPLTMLH